VLGQRKAKRSGRWVTGKLQDRLDDLQNLDKIEEFFIITDITTLRQCEKQKYVDKNGKQRTQKVFFMADLIEHWCQQGQIGRILLDESHVFKNIDSDQTQALLRIKNCPYKIAMTGTPIMNKNIDLYPIMSWLGYENKNYWEFRDKYCKMGGFKGKQIVGDKNSRELHARISQFMIRRKKEDVLDLPPKIFINEVLEMDGKQWALYQKMQSFVKSQLAQMKGNKNALLGAMLNLRKITCHPGWVDEDYKDSVKYERARQIIYEASENNQKTIIFSCFTTPFESDLECVNLKKDLEVYNPAMIIGDTKDRMEQVEKFQNDPTCKVIIGSIGAMGVGLTLNAAANVIFLDEPWNKALKDQAVDRSHRPGTKHTVNVYTLMCKDTVDEGVHKIVTKKGRLADEIVDGVSVEELEQLLEGTI
jgi:SNF2 family DNA or RNA helicase